MPTDNPTQVNTMSVLGDLDLTSLETELRFLDGRIVRLPTALLQQQQRPPFENPQTNNLSSGEGVRIPLAEEQLQVDKRTVETGRVRLQKSTEAYDVTLDEPLIMNKWKVERLPKHEVVAEVPAPRQEGNTTIYPLVEERLILTKELVLIEEICLTREIYQRRNTQTVTLRRETLNVERVSSLQG